MVSALGADVVTSTAAARAGVRRARALPELMLADPDSGADAPPIGHPIDRLTMGFEGRARLLRLLVAGLEDLARQSWPGEPKGPVDQEASLYLALPDPRRPFSQLEDISDDEVRKSYEEDAAAAPSEAIEQLAAELLGIALPILGWTMPLRLAFVGRGRTGFAAALARAAAEPRAAGPCIVGGVDSLLDPSTLLWLHRRRALKFSGNPVGIEPGEAAAFVMLDRSGRGKRARGLPEVSLLDVTVQPQPSGAPAALGLANLIVSAQESTRSSAAPTWLSMDLDGTPAVANAWGEAFVHLSRRWTGFNPRLQLPAVSFGETGAATGAVATCLALAGWSRRWAGGSSCILAETDPTHFAGHVLGETNSRRGTA